MRRVAGEASPRPRRRRRARTPTTNCRTIPATANAPRPNASTVVMPRVPSAEGDQHRGARRHTPAAADGGAARRRSWPATAGPARSPSGTAATSTIGVVIRLKYGSPTDSCWPWSASARSGNTVPSSTTKAKPANSRLLTRNARFAETGESIRPGDRSRSPRHTMSTIPTAATTTEEGEQPRPDVGLGEGVHGVRARRCG